MSKKKERKEEDELSQNVENPCATSMLNFVSEEFSVNCPDAIFCS